MSIPKLSKKGQELVKMYENMAKEGYVREYKDQKERVDIAFSDFELRPYRPQIRSIFEQHSISTVLDYGCGGSNWQTQGFDEKTNQSAVEYFKLMSAYHYEPARGIDERQAVDCVISFDMLEHIFISDVPTILRDLFSYASKLLIVNVACYLAGAKLPNGENAHITIRDPIWWKGMVDSISIEYPETTVRLIFSTAWRKSSAFPEWRAGAWQESDTFATDEKFKFN